MQNATLRTATGCTQGTNLQHLNDKTLTLPMHEHLQLHTPSIHRIPYTSLQHTSTLQGSKMHYLQQRPLHNKLPTDPHPHTVTKSNIRTNMCHIHRSIVSMHLATKGNNKILRTPPPHIISSEEILCRLTRHTLAQLRTNKLPFLKSYLHKVDSKSHTSPLCPLCNTHTHDTHHLFNCIHIHTTLSPLDLWTDPAGVSELWLVDHTREDRTRKGQRSRRQQQQHECYCIM